MKYATLAWVKPAIDDTLKQTRQSLEQFVENPDDTRPLQDAVNWLHEIHGALVMLEISNAVMLVQEMSLVTQGVLQGQITSKEAAYDALMRCLIQLPNYLDHLALGYADMPVALLPLLNRLRALRKQPAIPAHTQFTPDVNAPIPAKPSATLADDKLKDFIQKLRAVYQKGLILWIKGPDRIEGLKTLLTVMERLQQVTGGAPLTRVWWILEALLEAISQKGLAPSETFNTILKQLDSLIKPMAEHGNAGIRVIPPSKFVTTLLHLAASAKSRGARLLAVKKAFSLDSFMPNEAQLAAAQQIFSGPDIELMKTVVSTMKDDFTRIEETLDIFQRADSPDINDLEPLNEIMRPAAFTLSLLGLNAQAKSMLEQAVNIKAIREGKKPHDLPQMLTIAYSLLKINAAMETLGSRGIHAREQLQQEAGLHETQFNAVLKAAVSEAKIELAEVIQRITVFMDSNTIDEHLLALPDRLRQIQGMLWILSQGRAVKLLNMCIQYIAEKIVKQNQQPAEKERKALADVLISLEAYLDTVAGHPLDGNRILNTTEHALAVLLPPRPAATKA
jgi:chemosensory pili system protein ChpA (sensor histidine kinase/response regulator)